VVAFTFAISVAFAFPSTLCFSFVSAITLAFLFKSCVSICDHNSDCALRLSFFLTLRFSTFWTRFFSIAFAFAIAIAIAGGKLIFPYRQR
jgi:hypothetical protein